MKHLKLYEAADQKTTIVVFGLPGSGKSKLAEEIRRQEPEMNWQIHDDFSYREAIDKMGQENQIISDGMLILNPESSRQALTTKAKFTGSIIKFIYFENSPEQCKSNAKRRAEGPDVKSHQKGDGLLAQINQMAIAYKIPKDETPIEVWNPSKES